MDELTAFFSIFWAKITDFVVDALEMLFNIVGWVFYCMFDGFLAVVYSFFEALDLSSVAFGMASSWSSLPPQLIWLVNELAIPQCITIIVGALGIRMLLNLIPAAITRI